LVLAREKGTAEVVLVQNRVQESDAHNGPVGMAKDLGEGGIVSYIDEFHAVRFCSVQR
jgi:hypothetical protein